MDRKTEAEQWMDEYTDDEGKYNAVFHAKYREPKWQQVKVWNEDKEREEWKVWYVGEEADIYTKEVFGDGSSVVAGIDHAYIGTGSHEHCICGEEYQCDMCKEMEEGYVLQLGDVKALYASGILFGPDGFDPSKPNEWYADAFVTGEALDGCVWEINGEEIPVIGITKAAYDWIVEKAEEIRREEADDE